MSAFSRLATVVSLAVAAYTGGLFAQSLTSLNGVATDSTGGVVGKVSIELVSKGTDARRTTVTDPQGRYSFPQIAPGAYRLEGKASGFKAVVLDDLLLQVNTPATVNLTLQVGAVSESVSVI